LVFAKDYLHRKEDVSFQEKSTWVMLLLVTLVYGTYFVVVMGDVAAMPEVREIAYRGMMLATVVILTVLAAGTHIVLAIASPREADKTDERDREVNRFGEYVGGFVLVVGVLIGLGLAMFEIDHFWIANALLAGLVLSEVVAGLTKVVLYRRGL
jgi:hypothetical protein